MSIENGPEHGDDFIDPKKVLEEVREHPERTGAGLGILNPQLAQMRRIIDDTRKLIDEAEAAGNAERVSELKEYLEDFFTRESEFAAVILEIKRIREDYERKK